MQILYIIPLSSKYILLTIFKTFMSEGVIAYVNTYKSGLRKFSSSNASWGNFLSLLRLARVSYC